MGKFVSSSFPLAAGPITFDYSGNGGYVALCVGDGSSNCMRAYPASEAKPMQPGAFDEDALAGWIGKDVHFELVDDDPGPCWGDFRGVYNVKGMPPGGRSRPCGP